MRKILCVLLATIMCLSTLSVAASTTNPMDIVVDKTSVEYGATEAIVNISIPKYNAETIMHYLEQKDIYV